MSKAVFEVLRMVISLPLGQAVGNHPARGRFQGDSYGHCVSLDEHLSTFQHFCMVFCNPLPTGFVRTVWQVLQNQDRSSYIFMCACTSVCVYICFYMHIHIHIYAICMLIVGHVTFTLGTQGDTSSLDYTLTVLGPETSLALKPFERKRSLVIEVFPRHHSGRTAEWLCHQSRSNE